MLSLHIIWFIHFVHSVDDTEIDQLFTSFQNPSIVSPPQSPLGISDYVGNHNDQNEHTKDIPNETRIPISDTMSSESNTPFVPLKEIASGETSQQRDFSNEARMLNSNTMIPSGGPAFTNSGLEKIYASLASIKARQVRQDRDVASIKRRLPDSLVFHLSTFILSKTNDFDSIMIEFTNRNKHQCGNKQYRNKSNCFTRRFKSKAEKAWF